MRENIYVLGRLLGLTKKEVKDKFDDIVAFSELEEFVSAKLYQFSSGMLQRLVFSVAIHSNPDVLLLDEVLAVGDEKFRKKVIEEIMFLAKQGAAIIWVSHELWMIEKYCKSVLWMEKGKIREVGTAKNIVEHYAVS